MIKNIFFYGMYGLFILVMGVIIFISVINPRDHLLAWQMCIGTAVFGVLILLATALWDKIYGKIKHYKIFFAVGLILFGGALYGINCIARNEPNSLVDYMRLWENAMELATENDIINLDYFCMYSNNIKPMLLLSLMFRVAFKLGFHDPFYFVLVFSVLEVFLAVWAVAVLAGRRKLYIPILCFFVFCLPIWANTQAFYTDTMSFGNAVIAMAFMKLSMRETRVRRAVYAIVAGMVAGLGIIIKVTVCIPFIAAIIIIIFGAKESYSVRKLAISILWGVLGLAAIYTIVYFWADTYEITRMAKETTDPVIAWIALGLKGNGSYFDNHEFANALHELSTKAEKICTPKNI